MAECSHRWRDWLYGIESEASEQAERQRAKLDAESKQGQEVAHEEGSTLLAENATDKKDAAFQPSEIVQPM